MMSEVENIEQLEPKQPNEGINYYLKSDQFSELQGDLIAKVAETSGQ